jgi:hypothetical protein
MKTQQPTLGWALACLGAEEQGKSARFSPADRDYLYKIRGRCRSMKSNGRLSEALDTIPGQACSMGQPFLQQNEDFFIALFSDTRHDEACIKLYKHLNDCYWCFEIFSQFLCDYYRYGEVLQENYGEVRHG